MHTVQVNGWDFVPALNHIKRGNETVRLEPKAVDLLAYLVEHPGEVISKDELVREVWGGAFVSDDAVTSAISDIRKAFGDDPRSPVLIQTVPRRGYRFIGQVKSSEGEPSTKPAEEPQESRLEFLHGRPPLRRNAVIVAGVAVLVLVLLASWLTSPKSALSVPFQSRDFVLLTDFENRTGESELGRNLPYAVGLELSTSGFVNVAPRPRIRDTLALMRMAPDSPVTPQLGMDIARRDAGIRAIVTGLVERSGGRYLIGVEILDPSNGAVVAGRSFEEASRDKLLESAHAISDWVRMTLGERHAEIQNRDALPRVTTSSLQALELYRKADQLIVSGNHATAEQLLKRAVELDPGFASAYIHLAYALFNQYRPAEEVLVPARQALWLSGGYPERERLFIQASYEAMNGQTDSALSTFQALAELYSDHYWAANNAAVSAWWTAREREALPSLVRFADLVPNDFGGNFMAAEALFSVEADYDRASRYAERALAIAKVTGEGKSYFVPLMKSLPVRKAWATADIPGLSLELQKLKREFHATTDASERTLIAEVMACGHRLLGQERELTALLLARDPDPLNYLNAAEKAYLRQDLDSLRKAIHQFAAFSVPYREPQCLMLMIRSGDLAAAKHMFASWRKTSYASREEGKGFVKLIEGEMKAAEGDKRSALVSLRQGMKQPHPSGWPTTLMAASTFAKLLAEEGRIEEALSVRERISSARAAAAFRAGAHYWLANQLELVKLYRTAGERGKADVTLKRLKEDLALADPDHPLVQAMRNLE